MLRKVILLLVGAGLMLATPCPLMAAKTLNTLKSTKITKLLSQKPLNMNQIYTYAQRGDIKSLRSLGRMIDGIDKNGNSALCNAVLRNDYSTFSTLKMAGANIKHPCVNNIPESQIRQFNANYSNWARGYNDRIQNSNINGTLSTASGKIAITTGLSTAAKVGIGVGSVALIGGGIAIASGGGGGAGGSSAPDACYGISCGDHGSCSGGVCSCTDNYYGSRCESAPLSCGSHGSWNTTTHICDCSGGYTGNQCQTAPSSGCPANTYGSNGTCHSCPANSTAPAGAFTISECVCDSGYEKFGTDACVKTDSTKTWSSIIATEFGTGDSNYSKGRFLPIINAASAYEKFIRVTTKTGTSNFITEYDTSALSEVRVAVMDTGVNAANTAINFATDSSGNKLQFDYATPTSSGSGCHGTAVAGVISSKWNTSKTSSQINGVAPNATIIDWMIDQTGECMNRGDCPGMTIDYLNQVSSQNPRVYNLSWDFDGYDQNDDSKYRYADTWDTVPDGYTQNNFDLTFTNDSFWNAFLKKIATTDSVLVISSGNQNKTQNTQLLSAAPLSSTFSSDEYNLANKMVVSVALNMAATINNSDPVSSVKGITSYSSGCGVAAGWCISAPAGDYVKSGTTTIDTRLYSTGFSSGLTRFWGTSASAPITSGSIAFLMGAYPYLKANQVVEILFRTANTSFTGWSDAANVKTNWTDSFGNTYQVGSIYGHGLVDLGAAVEAQGELKVPVSSSGGAAEPLASISKQSLTNTKLSLPRVLNTNLTLSIPSVIMALDDYNRPYTIKSGNLITQAHHSSDSFKRYFKSFMNKTERSFSGIPDKLSFSFSSSQTNNNLLGFGVLDMNYKFNDTASLKFSYRSDTLEEEKHFDKALANPFVDMKDSYGLSQSFKLSNNLSFNTNAYMGKNGFFEGDDDYDDDFDEPVYAFSADVVYKLLHNLKLHILGGILKEEDSVLGINGTGILNTENSTTSFTAASVEYNPTDNITLTGTYYYGKSSIPRSSNSIVSFSKIASDSFALDARMALDKKRNLGLQFFSPLRIRNGDATFKIPVGRDNYSDTIYYDDTKVSLKPTAREYDMGFYFNKETYYGDWRTEFVTRFHPDHRAEARPDYRILFGYNMKY